MNNKKSIFDIYNEARRDLKEVARTRSNLLLNGFVSFLWALLIVIGPVIVLGNCFIFNDFIGLVLVGFVVCLMLLIYLTRVFYFQSVSQGSVKNMMFFHLVDGMIYMTLTIALAIAFYYL